MYLIDWDIAKVIRFWVYSFGLYCITIFVTFIVANFWFGFSLTFADFVLGFGDGLVYLFFSLLNISFKFVIFLVYRLWWESQTEIIIVDNNVNDYDKYCLILKNNTVKSDYDDLVCELCNYYFFEGNAYPEKV